MVDLPHEIFRLRPGIQHAPEHLGSPKNNAQRIAQIMRYYAQYVAFESVYLLQLGPSGREPTIGAGQFPRAIGNPLFKLRIRLLKLLIENNIVECDGKPAGEDFNERAVGG